MSVPLRLEEFESRDTEANAKEGPSVASERERLDAYEEGYRAGWDDAVASQESDKARFSTEFQNNLQEMSFTFHEARAHVLKNLRPLLQEMVDKVVPNLAREKLGQIVVDQVIEIARDRDNIIIEIHAAPGNHDALEQLLSDEDSLPVRLVSVSTLSDGEVHLRFGNEERQVNLDSVISKIQASTNDFFELSKKVNG